MAFADLPAANRAEIQRILDAEARRIMAEQIEAKRRTEPNRKEASR
jgi:hypothetical protein